MLERIGLASARELFSDIPDEFLLPAGSLELPPAASEADIVRRFERAAARNRHAGECRCFLGAGTYHHFIPAAVDAVLSRAEFLTAYTPYQPEISQGTLQTLFEFQTMVARLTGMEVANASMYDAATSVAEAALMARRVSGRMRVVLAPSVHPRYRAVTRGYLRRCGSAPVEGSATGFDTDVEALCAAVDKDTACVIVQYPDFYGGVFDLSPLRARCDATGALLVVAFSDATAFALIEPPGAFGADIVAGSGQALGIPMAYGGPHLGLFACRRRFVRRMPGRLCGMTHDAKGRRGFVLTLATREQHIRRGRATSNICSNQGLMCTAAAVHMALLGDAGLRQVAERSAAALAMLTGGLPAEVVAASGARYNETVLSFPSARVRDRFLARALAAGLFAGIPLEQLQPGREPRHLLVATTEMLGAEDIHAYLCLLDEAT